MSYYKVTPIIARSQSRCVLSAHEREGRLQNSVASGPECEWSSGMNREEASQLLQYGACGSRALIICSSKRWVSPDTRLVNRHLPIFGSSLHRG